MVCRWSHFDQNLNLYSYAMYVLVYRSGINQTESTIRNETTSRRCNAKTKQNYFFSFVPLSIQLAYKLFTVLAFYFHIFLCLLLLFSVYLNAFLTKCNLFCTMHNRWRKQRPTNNPRFPFTHSTESAAKMRKKQQSYDLKSFSRLNCVPPKWNGLNQCISIQMSIKRFSSQFSLRSVPFAYCHLHQQQ